jgi:hypothetical protein
MLPTQVQAVQKLPRLKAKAVSKPQNRVQLLLASATLKTTNARRVNVRLSRQVVLRDAFTPTKLAHPLAESSAGAVGVVVELCHSGSVAAPDRSDQSIAAGSALVGSTLV